MFANPLYYCHYFQGRSNIYIKQNKIYIEKMTMLV